MKKALGGFTTAAILIFVIVVFLFCTVRIPAGYVGVVYNMNGGISDKTLTQGFHVISPTQNVTTYSIGIEQSYLTASEDGDSSSDESFEVPSNDGKGLTVDMTFTYRYDADRVADTFTRFKGQSGKDVKNSFIKPNIMSWTKEVTAKYSVIDLLGDKRATLNSELTDYLKQKFEPYGIVIESVSLINIDPDEETALPFRKRSTPSKIWSLPRSSSRPPTSTLKRKRRLLSPRPIRKKKPLRSMPRQS